MGRTRPLFILCLCYGVGRHSTEREPLPTWSTPTIILGGGGSSCTGFEHLRDGCVVVMVVTLKINGMAKPDLQYSTNPIPPLLFRPLPPLSFFLIPILFCIFP